MEATIISKKELYELFAEEEASGKEFVEWERFQEVEGLEYSVYTDTRTGKQYAVRELRTVHMGFNSNEPGTVEKLVEIVEREGACKASWGVTGRTMHSILAAELEKELPQYDFDIGYNYKCVVSKKGHVSGEEEVA